MFFLLAHNEFQVKIIFLKYGILGDQIQSTQSPNPHFVNKMMKIVYFL